MIIYFLAWIARSKNSQNKAWCKYCKCDIQAHTTMLKNHAITDKHIQTVETAKLISKSMPSIETCMSSLSFTDQIKSSELILASYIASSRKAFNASDSMVNVFKAIAKKDHVVKNIKVLC